MDDSTMIQTAQAVAGQMSNNTPFNVIGPNAATVIQQAGIINGSLSPSDSIASPQTISPGTATATNTTTGGLPPQIAGTISNGQMTPNPNSPVQQAQVGSGSSITTWISAHMGNWGLIGIGVVLGLGALLISQKQTLITVGKQAAKMGVTGT
jgi:hypothetical protein